MKNWRTANTGTWTKGANKPIPLSNSNIPPRDWKYWCTVALSLAWFALLMLLLWRSSYTPTINQWWRTQADQEHGLPKAVQEARVLRDSTVPAEKGTGFKIPFPQENGYYKLGFDVLAGFPSEKPEISATPAALKNPKTRVPGIVRSMDGRKISVAGFMIPMAMDDKDRVLSFILAQSRTTCCYGIIPKLNQWIYVTMDRGKTVDQLMDVPVTVFGTIAVGAKFDEENKGWCLYRMVSDKVDFPKNSWF